LCFVGILSYFEAFCKDHAGSVISIAPHLIEQFRAAEYDTSIDAGKVVKLAEKLGARIGVLILEPVDFGGARNINSIYNCLLKITPFSKVDAVHYEELLRDRNLIVHHGSVFKTQYVDQSKGGQKLDLSSDAYMNSLVVDAGRVSSEIKFLFDIARKTMIAAHKVLQSQVGEGSLVLDHERQQALVFRVVGIQCEIQTGIHRSVGRLKTKLNQSLSCEFAALRAHHKPNRSL
jgi:hypothetical protein